MKNIKKKILIVEDSEYYMNLVTDSLINIENTILYKAVNISEAYRIAMEKNIDVFIVDVVLDTKVLGDVDFRLLSLLHLWKIPSITHIIICIVLDILKKRMTFQNWWKL